MSLSQSLDDWLKPTDEDVDGSGVVGVDDPMGGIPDLPDLGLGSLSAEDMKWVDLEFLDLASGPFANPDHHKNKNKSNPTLGYNFPDIFFDSTTSTSLFHNSFSGTQDDAFKDPSLDILADLFPSNEPEDDPDEANRGALRARSPTQAEEDEATDQLLSDIVLEASKSDPRAHENRVDGDEAAERGAKTTGGEDEGIYTVPIEVLQIISEKFDPKLVEALAKDVSEVRAPVKRMKAFVQTSVEKPPAQALAQVVLKTDPVHNKTRITILPVKADQGPKQSFEVSTSDRASAVRMLRSLHLEQLGVFKNFWPSSTSRPSTQDQSRTDSKATALFKDKPMASLRSLAHHGIQMSDFSYRNGPDGQKHWLCPEKDCDKAFDRPAKLKIHIFGHRGVRPFPCQAPDCHRAFATAAKLQRHTSSHKKEKHFACKLEGCASTFSTIYTLKAHLRLHEESLKFTCPHCNKRFDSDRAYQAHLKRHNPNLGILKCSSCSKEFLSHHALTQHAPCLASGQPEIRCSVPECGRQFKTFSLLKTHNLIHTGERPHGCEFPGCAWTFRTISKLRRHEKKHRDIRNHVCSICQKAFLRAEHLKAHASIHLDVKNASVCPFNGCSVKFADQASLISHIQEHGGDSTDPTHRPSKLVTVDESAITVKKPHGKPIILSTSYGFGNSVPS
ncbi:hypothetical protein TCAL_10773 [Tigriopus californicus]|uniref:C2H2-type domain-containing protein n=1 Tax=Tigriopus californicus TaxID=6832 RepID=A0A553NF65_TIGCA|nr:zinc finger protein 135-like [Tigriopus californicus]TRY64086.1 hypothetical protein TCAL_10773 [Tigriopus californicus]|eukprot:TCALIF_10773-PA protein Name:"Similar to ZXDB Zinc finger X-linked protein ZXDB (Homo sapiens)" AED:0.17 eAED:0.17 QI:0/0/0/0.5/1/1/2/0/672